MRLYVFMAGLAVMILSQPASCFPVSFVFHALKLSSLARVLYIRNGVWSHGVAKTER